MKTVLFLCLAVLWGANVRLHAADARENYERMCALCHGEDGKGKTKMGEKSGAKDLTDRKLQEGVKDAEMMKAIKEGVKDKETGKFRMVAFGETLSEEEVKALVAYVRAFKPK
jgi:mono/diheme cytochrome c family protein